MRRARVRLLRVHCYACGHDRLAAFSCKGQCRSVTFIRRFGSALNLTPHFHTPVLDGVSV